MIDQAQVAEGFSSTHRNFTRFFEVLLAAFVFIACFAGISASASAATLSVAIGGTDAGDCQSSDCATLQYAIDQSVSGDVIEIGPGQFAGASVDSTDITIRGAGRSATNTTIVPASSPLTPCDPVTGWTGVICVYASTVTIRDLIVDGQDQGGINNQFSGIHLIDSGGLVSNVETLGTQVGPIDESDGGYGISALDSDGNYRKLRVFNSYIHGFQSAGIVSTSDSFSSAYLEMQVDETEIAGRGDTDSLPQNGIDFETGLTLSATGNLFRDLAFKGTSGETASGILLEDVGKADVSGNRFSDVQAGVNGELACGCTELKVRGNTFTGQVVTDPSFPEVAGVTLTQGAVSIEGNTFEMTRDPTNDLQVAIQLWPGFFLLQTEITGNTIVGAQVGILAQSGLVGESNVNVEGNRIAGNETGIENDSPDPILARNNWWGCNDGANLAGCDSTVGDDIAVEPHVVMSVGALPSNIYADGGQSQITASLRKNSVGGQVCGCMPDTDLGFTTDLGSVDPSGELLDGLATSVLTAGSSTGTATVEATLDAEAQSVPVLVKAAPTGPTG
ncbi:MAG: hypothetical protein KDB66_02040, partial [Solirubrobacterales bacterium]|nr:hypothetical protein [Solirubrobacterales bacterium]